MNIFFGDAVAEELSEKYTILELDRFEIPGADSPQTAYAVIENVPAEELFHGRPYRDLHQNLMKNYYQQNWNYCEQAIEHLLGKWDKELDSFYLALLERIQSYKLNPPGEDWSGTIIKKQR